MNEGMIINLGYLIVGALLGAWITYRLSISLARRSEKHIAAIKFRDAFKGEILALNPSHHAIDEDLPVFLEKAFLKHETAIYDFSFFLDAKAKTALYEAWKEYYCHPNAQDEKAIPFLYQYSCRGLTLGQIHNMKNLVSSRLEAILMFTEKI